MGVVSHVRFSYLEHGVAGVAEGILFRLNSYQSHSSSVLVYSAFIYRMRFRIFSQESSVDHRKHFAHLLEHLIAETPSKCERLCPIGRSEGGGTFLPGYSEYRTSGYSGPDIYMLFDVMERLDLVVKAGPVADTYFPTPHGIDFLRNHEHPRMHWLGKNWLPASVAGATILTSIVSSLAYFASILNWFD